MPNPAVVALPSHAMLREACRSDVVDVQRREKCMKKFVLTSSIDDRLIFALAAIGVAQLTGRIASFALRCALQ
jgi:hypothetical protein